MDSLQQNTPETGETFVLIIHPHHPLVGQRVRSVRQTGPETDRQWVIELDDQTCARIPLSWAVPDDESTPLEPNSPPVSLWVDGKPYLIKNAKRVILFNRNFNGTDGSSRKEICIGLATANGNGVLVKYRADDKTYTINKVENGLPDEKVVLQDQPRIPEMEEK